MKLKDFGISFVGDVIASFAAHNLAHRGQDKDDNGEKSTPAEVAGRLIRQKLEEMKFDRGEFLHELRVINARTGEEIKPIIDLFNEFEKNRGILWIGGRLYRENWVGKMLMEVPPEHRTENYRWLAETLSTSREDFFAMLEILNDDKLQQIVRQLFVQAKQFADDHKISDKLERADKSVASLLDSILK